MQIGIALASCLLLAATLSACSSTPPTGQTGGQPAKTGSNVDTAAPQTHSVTPTKPLLVDLNAENSWRAACALPLATVAQQTAPLGTDVKELDYNQLGDAECEYDTAHSSSIPSLGIQLREYDSSTSYGTNDTGTGEWHAPDPATGYQQACQAWGGQCVTGIGDGVALSEDGTTAQVFLNGPYFYQLQLYELQGSSGSGQILLTLAKELGTAPAPGS
jgi:hypothetical protein